MFTFQDFAAALAYAVIAAVAIGAIVWLIVLRDPFDFGDLDDDQ